MEILSENVGEEKEKPEKAANVTVHDVYIKTKDKKRTDRKTEAKELIKQELNLKLSVLSRLCNVVRTRGIDNQYRTSPNYFRHRWNN